MGRRWSGLRLEESVPTQMTSTRKTVIVIGDSQGIGAGLVKAFLDRGYNVVTDYTAEDLRALASVNLEGFLLVTQMAVKRMLAQNAGGSIVNLIAPGKSSDRGDQFVRRDDDQVRPGSRHAKLRDGICQAGHMRQRAAADGPDFRGERRRGRDRLSDRSRSSDRGDAARGWRCTLKQVVTGPTRGRRPTR
jgi:hypothetical protein